MYIYENKYVHCHTVGHKYRRHATTTSICLPITMLFMCEVICFRRSVSKAIKVT